MLYDLSSATFLKKDVSFKGYLWENRYKNSSDVQEIGDKILFIW